MAMGMKEGLKRKDGGFGILLGNLGRVIGVGGYSMWDEPCGCDRSGLKKSLGLECRIGNILINHYG